jgi:hypothetical protein
LIFKEKQENEVEEEESNSRKKISTAMVENEFI